MDLNGLFIETFKPVVGLAPRTPSSSTPDYVSLKGFEKLVVLIVVDNATTVTGSAITVQQAQTVAAGGEKPVAFTKVWRNIDIDAADALTEAAVTSNTFTTDATNNKNLLYVIEVTPAMLDRNNGFDCVRAGTGNATSAVLGVVYLLYPPKYGKASLISAIVD